MIFVLRGSFYHCITNSLLGNNFQINEDKETPNFPDFVDVQVSKKLE